MKFLFPSLIFLLFVSIQSLAQPGGGPPQNPPPVPITGVEYLLLSGGAYGVYRIMKKGNSTNKP